MQAAIGAAAKLYRHKFPIARVPPPFQWPTNKIAVETELPKFYDCGFLVEYSDECFPRLKFLDVGAVVFWAKIIKWSFPGFSVERNFDRICALQDDINQNGFISDLEHRFIIVAQNTK